MLSVNTTQYRVSNITSIYVHNETNSLPVIDMYWLHNL